MSQTEKVEPEDVRAIMLDANGALQDDDYQTALEKLKKAKRRCGVLAREEGSR